jgi:hypothetical protein
LHRSLGKGAERRKKWDATEVEVKVIAGDGAGGPHAPVQSVPGGMSALPAG